jgi:hypothetical protein
MLKMMKTIITTRNYTSFSQQSAINENGISEWVLKTQLESNKLIVKYQYKHDSRLLMFAVEYDIIKIQVIDAIRNDLMAFCFFEIKYSKTLFDFKL